MRFKRHFKLVCPDTGKQLEVITGHSMGHYSGFEIFVLCEIVINGVLNHSERLSMMQVSPTRETAKTIVGHPSGLYDGIRITLSIRAAGYQS